MASVTAVTRPRSARGMCFSISVATASTTRGTSVLAISLPMVFRIMGVLSVYDVK
ncbi:minor tail subunit [Mycobacterium phage BTCU-1]|uniref:Minor tail subunit n=1 Tax=Mycobacterium phage BTCU-1 TaxID=1262532 RepID=R9R4B6_9CAUD|nr:minor tail subunit [Mycobacterium phage BTCU-1]AGI61687.1 minor tail subunit [Mycobacterium phage BTCU-1]